MKIVTIGNVNDFVYKVQEHSKGLVFDTIGLATTIKVDFRSDTLGTSNVYPEMTVLQLMDIFNAFQTRGFIEKVDDTKVYDFVLPFSNSGVLLFDDDNYYVVTIDGILADSTDVYNVDDVRHGHPIRIKRDDIKASLTEKSFDFTGISHLFFPNGNPDLIEHNVTAPNGKLRKVSIDSKQIDLIAQENRITRYQVQANVGAADAALPVNNPLIGLIKNVLPVGRINDAVLHKTGGEYIFYKIQA